jgi:hypothetical protein
MLLFKPAKEAFYQNASLSAWEIKNNMVREEFSVTAREEFYQNASLFLSFF